MNKRNLLVEGSGKCQNIKGCEYLCKDTMKKLGQEEGIKQLIICASDYQSCHFLQAFSSPIYLEDMTPYWNQTQELQQVCPEDFYFAPGSVEFQNRIKNLLSKLNTKKLKWQD